MENDRRDVVAVVDASRVEKRGGVTAEARIGALPRDPLGGADRQLNRRAGHEYELLPPEVAINPSEDAVSIDAAIAMRGMFAAPRSPRTSASVGHDRQQRVELRPSTFKPLAFRLDSRRTATTRRSPSHLNLPGSSR